MELGFDPRSVPPGDPKDLCSRAEERHEGRSPLSPSSLREPLWGRNTQARPLPLPSSAARPLYPGSRTPPAVCQKYWRAGSSLWRPLMSTHSTAEAPAMVQTKHPLKRSAKKTNPQSLEHLEPDSSGFPLLSVIFPAKTQLTF